MQTKILYGLSALVLVLSVWLNVSLQTTHRQIAKRAISLTHIQPSQTEPTTKTDDSSGVVSTTVFVPSMPTKVKAEIKK